jgi:hypothetical protein
MALGRSHTNAVRVDIRMTENSKCTDFGNGVQVWYLNGKRHREDGPAWIGQDGYQEWWMNDQLHRQDGPALIDGRGHQEYWLHGELHRLDGPANIWEDGIQEWYANGQCHRLDGPAIIYPSGEQEWWVHGKEITTEVTQWMEQHGITYPWDEQTQMQFVLTFT